MLGVTHMNMLPAGISLIVLLLPFHALVAEQDPGRNTKGPAVPSAPHERLAYLEGTWELEPGGKPESIARQAGRREACGWLPGGRRHMVCRWMGDSPDEAGVEMMAIHSYREEDATYISYFVFASGPTLMYHGKPDGDRWVMEMQPTPLLPNNMRFRTIATPTRDGIHFVEEGSKDGGPWQIGEDYRYKRVR
jgi:hypothetical protein